MAESEAKQVGLAKVYLKDLSFESPMSPDLFEQRLQPEVRADIGCRGQHKKDNHYEVVLHLTLTGKAGEKDAFIVEIEQAGLFSIQGLSEDERSHAIHVFCPNILFPYARATVDHVMVQGGLPALALEPINFEALYQQNRSQEGGTSS